MSSYHTIKPQSREQAEISFQSGNVEQVCYSLLSLALHDGDPDWTLSKVIEVGSQSELNEVKSAAIISIGHLARIHRMIDLKKAKEFLDEVQKTSPNLQGQVEDAWDDISMFSNK